MIPHEIRYLSAYPDYLNLTSTTENTLKQLLNLVLQDVSCSNYSSAEDLCGSRWSSLTAVYSTGFNPSTATAGSAYCWKPAGLWVWSSLAVPGSLHIWINCEPAQLAQLEHNVIYTLIRNAIVPLSIILLPFFAFLHSQHETKRCISGTAVHKTGTWRNCGLCQPDNPQVRRFAGLHRCPAWDVNLLSGWCASTMLSLKEDA